MAVAGGMEPETDINKIIDTLGINDFREATKKADPRHLAENSQELNERMKQAISQLHEETKGLGRVLIVSHGDFIKTLAIKYWTGSNGSHVIPFPDNGSVSRGILHDDGKFEIVDYNVASKDLVNL